MPSNQKPLINKMQLRYPTSFLSLLLVGFGIVTLPLIAGLVSNAFSIERLSEQSQKAVYNATLATQSARQLGAMSLVLERTARFYAVSGDRELIDSYKRTRDNWLAQLTQLEALSWGLPVIASKHCGSAVTHNRNGWILDDIEPATISAAIRVALRQTLPDIRPPEFSIDDLGAALIR